jgi:hypothetical protein
VERASDDDVPEEATETGTEGVAEDTTTGAHVPTGDGGVPSIGEPTEEEDRTVRQSFELRLRHTPRVPPPARTPRMTSKKATDQGLGSPPLATRAASGYDPVVPPLVAPAPRPPPESDADPEADEGSVTATVPSAKVPKPLPLVTPGSVKIRELSEEDDELDETEIRAFTVPSPVGAPPKPVGPSSDDSVTAEAPPAMKFPQPRPAAGQAPDEVSSSDPMPAAHVMADDAYNADESVTTRGPAVLLYTDDSVTARKPVAKVPAALEVAPLFGDSTEGTTRKVAKPPPSAPAESEVESVKSAPENAAELLGSAPRPGLIADFRDPPSSSSESALHIAPAEAEVGDHASLSALMVNGLEQAAFDKSHRASFDGFANSSTAPSFPTPQSVPPVNSASVPMAVAKTQPRDLVPPPHLQPHEYGAGKKPRYGLLVTLVGIVSFVVPVALFLWLHQFESPTPPERSPTLVASDHLDRADPARGRKPVPSASVSAHPSATATPGKSVTNKRR